MTAAGARRFLTSSAGAALALALVAVVSFWPVVSGRRSFFHMDLYYEHLPVWAASQEALLAGESPFWLGGEYCGHPSLFLQEAPLFYPPTAPLLATGAPVHRLSDFFTLAHYWLAGFATFLLVRGLTGRAAAGLFGGIAWMLSARMIQTAIWPNAVAVSALLPLLLYGMLRLGRGQRRSGILVAALSAGLALLAARPHVLLAASPVLAAFAAAAVLRAERRRQVLLDLAVACVLALGLGAPSVVPSAALLPETSRSRGLSVDATDFQPLAHGRELDMVFLPVDGRARWPESAAYAGALPDALFLSGVYLLLRRRAPFSRAAFLACLLGGAAGLLLAFGDSGPYRWISRLPLLRSFRVPERFLLSWSLALAIGSALALAHWLDRSKRPAALAAACLLLLCADLVAHAWRSSPTAESEIYRVTPEVVGRLRSLLSTDEAGFPRRFISLAGSLNPVPYPDAERLRLLREAGALKGALGLRFDLESAYGAGPTLQRIEQMLLRPSRRAFSLAGVGVVVLSPPGRHGGSDPLSPPVLESAEPLPRALLVPEAVVVPAAQAVAATLSPAIDPRRTAVLEEGEPLAEDPAWRKEQARVRVVFRRPSRVALEAHLPAAGYLLLCDAYESGWRADVDGAPARVHRADGAFRAVRLFPGSHRVEFRYVPPGLREGLGLCLAALLGLVLLAVRLSPKNASNSRAGAPKTF